MEEPALHSGLEIRLTALATRIADLRGRMNLETERGRTNAFGEIEELEQRHRKLEADLALLDGEGPGFRQDVKAGIEAFADDLAGWVEDHVMWIDSGFQPDRKPAPAIVRDEKHPQAGLPAGAASS